MFGPDPAVGGFGCLIPADAVNAQKLVASLADLGGCDTVTRGPSNSGSVENLSYAYAEGHLTC